ncbi:pyrin-like isoform X2 [Lissotriton helveticus]
MADGSSPETAWDVIYHCLEELTGQEFRLFKTRLQDSAVEPGQKKIPRSRREDADRLDTAKNMIKHYGDRRALEITQHVLEKIPRKDLVEELEPLLQRYSNNKGKSCRANVEGL